MNLDISTLRSHIQKVSNKTSVYTGTNCGNTVIILKTTENVDVDPLKYTSLNSCVESFAKMSEIVLDSCQTTREGFARVFTYNVSKKHPTLVRRATQSEKVSVPSRDEQTFTIMPSFEELQEKNNRTRDFKNDDGGVRDEDDDDSKKSKFWPFIKSTLITLVTWTWYLIQLLWKVFKFLMKLVANFNSFLTAGIIVFLVFAVLIAYYSPSTAERMVGYGYHYAPEWVKMITGWKRDEATPMKDQVMNNINSIINEVRSTIKGNGGGSGGGVSPVTSSEQNK